MGSNIALAGEPRPLRTYLPEFNVSLVGYVLPSLEVVMMAKSSVSWWLFPDRLLVTTLYFTAGILLTCGVAVSPLWLR